MVKKIGRVIYHLKNGTFFESLYARLNYYKNNTEQKKQKKIRADRFSDWNTKLNNGSMIFPILKGVQLQLFADSRLSENIYCDDFEKQEQFFIRTILKPGDIFIDVGANIGLYTVIGASAVGVTGHVYSFEPSAKTFNRLVANVKLNQFDNISCNRLALSDNRSKAELYISLERWDAWNTFGKPTGTDGSTFGTEEVDMIPLDVFAAEQGISKVNLMKIDVEGWECKVLKGASKILNQADAPVLLVEFNDEALLAAGESSSELYDLLTGFGYSIYRQGKKPLELVPCLPKESYDMNLIAIKPAAKLPSCIIFTKRAQKRSVGRDSTNKVGVQNGCS